MTDDALTYNEPDPIVIEIDRQSWFNSHIIRKRSYRLTESGNPQKIKDIKYYDLIQQMTLMDDAFAQVFFENNLTAMTMLLKDHLGKARYSRY